MMRALPDAPIPKRLLSLAKSALLLGFALLVGGCVGPSETTGVKERDPITAHVQFLSQPALKGRKPGTNGSRAARHYIADRFREYGLAPWGGEEGYEHPFGLGKNVIGFLSGSDPSLKNQIVLVSAHYDHLGKDSKGRICPGAADNASGVAALLEIARQMSLIEPRPKRSILFAAFDCEEMMLFGSFAFCCQQEKRLTNLVGVINVDMLGRDFFDVVRHTVFVAGSEQYPGIREQIERAGARAGIRVLTLGTDLIGPRGDHVAFESRKIPCLFFSCGSFRDYHQPEDTPNRLNCEDITRSARVIQDTVRHLANNPVIESASRAESGYGDELRTVHTVLSEVNRDRSKAGVKPKDAEAFDKLAAEAEDLSASGRYDRENRAKLILDASGILAPYFLPADVSGKPQSPAEQEMTRLTLQYLQQFYIQYKDELMEGYRKLVAQLLKYRPGLVRGMPKFSYELYDVADRDISITPCSGDKYALDALASSFTIIAQVKSSKWLIKSFQGYIGSSLDPINCEGTREQLADFCLLRLRDEQRNGVHSAALKKILRTVTESEPKGDYTNLLAERLHRDGLKDETAWIVNCLQEDTPELSLQAIEAARHNPDPRINEALSIIITSPCIRPDVRAAAIDLVSSLRNQQLLRALCEVLGDPTLAYRREFMAMTREDYPFADRIVVRTALQIYDRQLEHSPSRTLGELAQARLKKLTKRDFGQDPKLWREWIDSHAPFPNS
jgi:hypothetical protein